MTQLSVKYGSVARFVAVYITEAHAKDEWPVGQTFSFCNQPKSTDERCGLAADFVARRRLGIRLLVDPIENDFEQTFGAWPFRYFIFDGSGRLALKAKPQPISFHYEPVKDLTRWLDIAAASANHSASS